MQLDGVRILLVDDDADSVEMYAFALSTFGARITTALSLADALTACEGGAFDVIVSDITLPDGDGLELLARLGAGRREGEPVPHSIALTGHAYPKDREEALSAGFDLYCVKPCAPFDLAEAVARLAAPQIAEARLAEPREARPLGGVRLLVVEDDEADRYLLERLLGAHGAEVRACESAAAALEALEAWVPHALVSDIRMPGASGYELLEAVRRLPPERGGRVPALAVTVLSTPADRAAVLRAGFQEHLPKPFEPRALVTTLAGLASAPS